FGNVILEAQASGLPVVVSDSGGPKELVMDRANGLITRSHDVEDFTCAIRTLVTDGALRERMANSARDSVTDRSWPRAFAKFWATTEVGTRRHSRCSHALGAVPCRLYTFKASTLEPDSLPGVATTVADRAHAMRSAHVPH